jgi:hypothetical protein
MVTIPPASTRDFTYRGERARLGDARPGRKRAEAFLPERRDDLREIRMSRGLTGTYAHGAADRRSDALDSSSPPTSS